MKVEPEWEDIAALFAMHAMMQRSNSMSYQDIADCSYKMAKAMNDKFINKSEGLNHERQTD